VQPSSDSDSADRILDGESGQDGEGAPFLPPIPEQEGVAPDEVIPTGPGSEAKATLRWLPETQMKRNKQNPSALITPRSVKVHLTLDPVKIPQITDSGRKSCPPRYGRRRSHSGCPRYVLPPSICRSFPHPIPSLLGMVSCFWIDGFHPTCGGQEVRRDGAKYGELFLSDSCSVQFSSVSTILTHYCMFMYR
jgi:hypothetical protein